MRFPMMMCSRLSRPVTSLSLRSCYHGSQVTVRHLVRGVCHSVCKPAVCVSSSPVVFQACRTVSSGRPGWYEVLADSGPVHLTEQLLVLSQQTSGLTWWTSIICTTLTLRSLITLPLSVYQIIIINKVEALQKEISVLAKQLSYEISVKAREMNWSEKTCRYQFKKNLRRLISDLYVRENCHPVKASLLIWVQLPMWVCVSLALRNLSVGAAHSSTGLQQELTVGGALWFPDLTLPDSTWIIPVCLGLTNLLITEIFALRQLEASKFQKYVTNLIRGISILMIPLAATVPSCMSLYWLSSSVVGLGHNLLLRSPKFRSLCRIPPSHSDSSTPYRDITAALLAKYSTSKS